MNKPKKDFGFPRWGAYGYDRDAKAVRLCDFHGCEEKGECPAPKSPHTDEKWMFCTEHAAEYNKNWNFFEGMKDEDAKAYAKRERQKSDGYAQKNPYAWGGAVGEDGLTPLERDAYNALELEPGANLDAIKKQFRALAKKYHPDHNRGDKETEELFQRVTFAYEVLKGRTSFSPKS
ncbi:MAG: J domain-containing protein [Sphingomonadales bacterium]